MSRGRPTVARVDLDAARANLAALRHRVPGREVIAVVKADAYGHGAVPLARALVGAGAERLAVLSVDEAAALRDAGLGAPILVLGGVHDAAEAREAAARGVTPVVHGAEGLALLAGAVPAGPEALPVHVELDTGMRRMGAAPEAAAELLAAAAATPRLRLEGVMTHLARADEADPAPSREQLALFGRLLGAARARGVDPGCVHAAASAGCLAWKALADAAPETHAVRPGIALYGADPMARPSPHAPAALAPVMTLATRVVAVRRIRRGEPVGYGDIWRAPRAGRIATLAVGYADGVPRCWGEPGRPPARVAIGGRRFPVAGRVSMDYVTVDLGEANDVSTGDEAVLFGRVAAGDVLPVEVLAEGAGTISYEILSRVGTRVPREIRGEDADA